MKRRNYLATYRRRMERDAWSPFWARYSYVRYSYRWAGPRLGDGPHGLWIL